MEGEQSAGAEVAEGAQVSTNHLSCADNPLTDSASENPAPAQVPEVRRARCGRPLAAPYQPGGDWEPEVISCRKRPVPGQGGRGSEKSPGADGGMHPLPHVIVTNFHSGVEVTIVSRPLNPRLVAVRLDGKVVFAVNSASLQAIPGKKVWIEREGNGYRVVGRYNRFGARVE